MLGSEAAGVGSSGSGDVESCRAMTLDEGTAVESNPTRGADGEPSCSGAPPEEAIEAGVPNALIRFHPSSSVLPGEKLIWLGEADDDAIGAGVLVICGALFSVLN